MMSLSRRKPSPANKEVAISASGIASTVEIHWLFAALVLVMLLLTGSPSLGGGLGIPTGHVGLGFGNLEDFTGVRINLTDRDIDHMSGLHGTLWIPKENDRAIYKGVSLNLVGLTAGQIQGIAFGGLGIGADSITGISFGGLGVGGGNITGIAFGGLGVGGDDITGIAFGGLGVGGNDITGIAWGGLGVGGEDITGIAVGGLGVGGEDLKGVLLGGIGVGGSSITGLAAGGAVGADRMRGACLSLAYLKGKSLRGIGTGAYTNLENSTGLTIGFFNRAQVLHGVQIGLLNYAGNNPAGVRWVPGINCHF